MKENLELLKEYVKILDNEGKLYTSYNLAKGYFIILHNFILIEHKFQADVTACNKEINKHLNLVHLDTVQDVYDLFFKLYHVNHVIRNNVETLVSVDSVRDYLISRLYIYTGFVDVV
jgi:hypothetical protein